jgi:Domain of unknown function (DUF397)
MYTEMTPPPLEAFGEFRAADPGNGTCGNDSPCVEVADGPDGWRALRDSKLGAGSPILTFTEAEWKVFTAGVRGGEFD